MKITLLTGEAVSIVDWLVADSSSLNCAMSYVEGILCMFSNGFSCFTNGKGHKQLAFPHHFSIDERRHSLCQINYVPK